MCITSRATSDTEVLSEFPDIFANLFQASGTQAIADTYNPFEEKAKSSTEPFLSLV